MGIADSQSELSIYQKDVTRLQREVEVAKKALAAVEEELSGAEAALEACATSRCTPSAEAVPNWDDNTEVPNLVDGATWTPVCDRGYKADFCTDKTNCGSGATEMTCEDGKLTPPTFRCAPIFSGNLQVRIKEGRKLVF